MTASTDAKESDNVVIDIVVVVAVVVVVVVVTDVDDVKVDDKRLWSQM